MHGIRQPASGRRRTYRAILGFHSYGFLFLSATRARGDNMRRDKEVWPRSTHLLSFHPSTRDGKRLDGPESGSGSPIHHQFLEVSKPSFELQVSTARLSFWITYIAFFIFVQAMIILRLRVSGSAVRVGSAPVRRSLVWIVHSVHFSLCSALLWSPHAFRCRTSRTRTRTRTRTRASDRSREGYHTYMYIDGEAHREG